MVSYTPTEWAAIETIRKKHHDICSSCPTRKTLAKLFDIHVDWMDCPYDCQNDYDHFLRTVKETGKWVYGTDYRHRHKCKRRRELRGYCSYEQYTSYNRALTYETQRDAEFDFEYRGCGRDYVIVEVLLCEKHNLFCGWKWKNI